MEDIKFIYFDLGGVFFHWRERLKILAERFKKDYEELEGIRIKYDDLVCRGKMTPEELWKKMQEEANFKAPPDFKFPEEWVKTFTPIPESHRFLERYVKEYPLRPVGILTNVYPEIYDLQIKYDLVPDLKYYPIIRSDQVGLVKPDPEIYKIAQEKVGVKSSEIFYVDDQMPNVEAARKLGWQAIWFEENNPAGMIREIRERLG